MALMIILAITLLTPVAIENEAPTDHFSMPTPDGWRTETIPFPLSFAPELEYIGIEELRFAPGMFKAESVDFWTYAFVWWIKKDTRISAPDLAKDLEIYFAGLAHSVADEGGFDISEATFEVDLKETESGRESEIIYVGQAVILDPFVTREMINLNIRVKQIPYPNHLAVIFSLSPQPYTHSVWKDLAEIREGFNSK